MITEQWFVKGVTISPENFRLKRVVVGNEGFQMIEDSEGVMIPMRRRILKMWQTATLAEECGKNPNPDNRTTEGGEFKVKKFD